MTSIPRTLLRLSFVVIAAVLLTTGLRAQDKGQANENGKAEAAPGKPVYVSPAARLAAAKTAVVRNAGGSEIPYNVVSSGLEGWGRFRLVESPSQADVIIEVSSPAEETSSVSAKSRVGARGNLENSTTTSRNVSEGPIRLVVYDARTHIALWSASEQPKGGFRQRAREDHLVEAASRLVSKFRERLEPPPLSK